MSKSALMASAAPVVIMPDTYYLRHCVVPQALATCMDLCMKAENVAFSPGALESLSNSVTEPMAGMEEYDFRRLGARILEDSDSIVSCMDAPTELARVLAMAIIVNKLRNAGKIAPMHVANMISWAILDEAGCGDPEEMADWSGAAGSTFAVSAGMNRISALGYL